MNPAQPATAYLQERVSAAKLALRAPTPEALEAARSALEEGVSLLRNSPSLERDGLLEVRRELKTVRSLLDRAGEFERNWSRIVFANACGYGPSGAITPPAPARTVVLDG